MTPGRTPIARRLALAGLLLAAALPAMAPPASAVCVYGTSIDLDPSDVCGIKQCLDNPMSCEPILPTVPDCVASAGSNPNSCTNPVCNLPIPCDPTPLLDPLLQPVWQTVACAQSGYEACLRQHGFDVQPCRDFGAWCYDPAGFALGILDDVLP